MLRKINRAYIRTYQDNGQTTAYVEWQDGKGREGRTEATAASRDFERSPVTIDGETFHLGPHMASLFARATREGVPIEHEVW